MKIKEIFDKTSNRETVFLYLIKKVAETPTKKDRYQIFNQVVTFIANEFGEVQEAIEGIKVHNSFCPDCDDPVDGDGCNNCDSAKS